MATRLAILFFASVFFVTNVAAETPRLLLTPQRLKRLKRERERQADRWVNFENRVRNVPDSPERGFELALYYAVTGDAASGTEALKWAHEHGCFPRQVALIHDWVPQSLDTYNGLIDGLCGSSGEISPEHARDELFTVVVSGSISNLKPLDISAFEDTVLASPDQLYALCEYLIALRDTDRTDLREQASGFFLKLPTEFLLSRTPETAARPDWKTHIAALALVALDPNLQSSQFVQSWAMEERQTVKEGPGVAYELLWADPYLPGVGYQNLELFIYDDAGRLFARTDWSPDACWIAISGISTKAEHCPADWKQKSFRFGHLTLMPLTTGCVQIPNMRNNEHVILWQLQPGQSVVFSADRGRSEQADRAGMLAVASNLAGRACVANGAKGQRLLK